MSFVKQTEYDLDHEFSTDELLQIQPNDLCNYYKYVCYGKMNPGVGDKPLNARSNTLYFSKKAISYFMPRKNVTWDSINQLGNPTRSIEVNELINKIKKHEVRKEGAVSQAVRALEYDEFINILTIIRTQNLFPNEEQFRLLSILTLQWQLIARIDDMMKLQLRNILTNPLHNFVLNFQMSWSKNIMDERDSPTQIILPSMNDNMCALMSLAVFLESATANYTSISDFLYGNGKDGDRSVRESLKKVIGE